MRQETVKRRILELALELRDELIHNILPFWTTRSRDPETGGFVGFLSNENEINPEEPRPVIMAAGQLWTYSRAARILREPRYLDEAAYAYADLFRHYPDRENGGLYWSVDAQGDPVISRKQTFGQSLAIGALAEYAAALEDYPLEYGPTEKPDTGDDPYLAGLSPDMNQGKIVLREALKLFSLLELHARDPQFGGYFEACGREWGPATETRLSETELDCDKSMETNLQVLASTVALHRAVKMVYPENQELLERIQESAETLLQVIIKRVIKDDYHGAQYFIRDWRMMNDQVSFGLDLEASWILYDAATEFEDQELRHMTRPVSLYLAKTALGEGFDWEAAQRAGEPMTDGTPFGALDKSQAGESETRDRSRDWRSQAAALIGFFNAWELSGDGKFLDALLGQWNWIKRFQRDIRYGDWFWAVSPEGLPQGDLPKGGFWKTPYHHSRALLEVLLRIRGDPETFELETRSFAERLSRLKGAYWALTQRKNLPQVDTGTLILYKHPVLTLSHIPPPWRYDLDEERNPYLMERMGVLALECVGAYHLEGVNGLMLCLRGADGRVFFAAVESPEASWGYRFREYPLGINLGSPGETIEFREASIVQQDKRSILGVFRAFTPRGDAASYRVLRTSDFETWEPLASFQAPAGGRFTLHPELIDGKLLLYRYDRRGISALFLSPEGELGKPFPLLKGASFLRGLAPIRTPQGYLHIGDRGSGLFLLATSLEDPLRVIAHSAGVLRVLPEDSADTIKVGAVIIDESRRILIYYGDQNNRIFLGETSAERLLDYCFNAPREAKSDSESFEHRITLIRNNQKLWNL